MSGALTENTDETVVRDFRSCKASAADLNVTPHRLIIVQKVESPSTCALRFAHLHAAGNVARLSFVGTARLDDRLFFTSAFDKMARRTPELLPSRFGTTECSIRVSISLMRGQLRHGAFVSMLASHLLSVLRCRPRNWVLHTPNSRDTRSAYCELSSISNWFIPAFVRLYDTQLVGKLRVFVSRSGQLFTSVPQRQRFALFALLRQARAFIADSPRFRAGRFWCRTRFVGCWSYHALRQHAHGTVRICADGAEHFVKHKRYAILHSTFGFVCLGRRSRSISSI